MRAERTHKIQRDGCSGRDHAATTGECIPRNHRADDDRAGVADAKRREWTARTYRNR
jgi:hypothetical protein